MTFNSCGCAQPVVISLFAPAASRARAAGHDLRSWVGPKSVRDGGRGAGLNGCATTKHFCRWDTRALYWGASYLSQASLTLTGPALNSSGAAERCVSNGTKQHQRVRKNLRPLSMPGPSTPISMVHATSLRLGGAWRWGLGGWLATTREAGVLTTKK